MFTVAPAPDVTCILSLISAPASSASHRIVAVYSVLVPAVTAYGCCVSLLNTLVAIIVYFKVVKINRQLHGLRMLITIGS